MEVRCSERASEGPRELGRWKGAGGCGGKGPGPRGLGALRSARATGPGTPCWAWGRASLGPRGCEPWVLSSGIGDRVPRRVFPMLQALSLPPSAERSLSGRLRVPGRPPALRLPPPPALSSVSPPGDGLPFHRPADAHNSPRRGVPLGKERTGPPAPRFSWRTAALHAPGQCCGSLGYLGERSGAEEGTLGGGCLSISWAGSSPA